MSGYAGIDGLGKSIPTMYIGVDNIARPIQRAYIGVDGVARLWYQNNIKLGSLKIGSVVKIKIGGVYRDFIVIHHGNPDEAIYDSSCNGTWLVQKNIYEKKEFNSTSAWPSRTNTYYGSKPSPLYTYLVEDYYSTIDIIAKSNIKAIRLPYWHGNGDASSGWKCLSNGLYCRIFLLSPGEVGRGSMEKNNDKTKPLAYFAENSKNRIATMNGAAADWWVRIPQSGNHRYAWAVGTSGGLVYKTAGDSSAGVRPAFVMNDNALVDKEGYIIE